MFTISYNVGNKRNLSETDFRSVGEVMNSASVQGLVGFDPSQVTPFVNGVEANYDDVIVANMHLRLVKKAGSKSEFMSSDEQLRPLGVSSTTRNLIIVEAAAAMAPLYDELSAAENKAEKELVAAQKAKIVELDGFEEMNEAIINSIVTKGYVDGVSLDVPAEINKELRRMAVKSQEGLTELRNKVSDAESVTNTWKNAVLADLELCVTVAEQRTVVAAAQKADPLKTWSLAKLG